MSFQVNSEPFIIFDFPFGIFPLWSCIFHTVQENLGIRQSDVHFTVQNTLTKRNACCRLALVLVTLLQQQIEDGWTTTALTTSGQTEWVWLHILASHPPSSSFLSLASHHLWRVKEHRSARSHPEDLIKDPISAWKWNALSSLVVMMGKKTYWEGLFGSKISAYANRA